MASKASQHSKRSWSELSGVNAVDSPSQKGRGEAGGPSQGKHCSRRNLRQLYSYLSHLKLGCFLSYCPLLSECVGFLGSHDAVAVIWLLSNVELLLLV